jgi:hypothetical protein
VGSGPVLCRFGIELNWLQFRFGPKMGKNRTKPDLQTLHGQRQVGKVNVSVGADVVVGSGNASWRSELGVGREDANTSSSTTSLALPIVASNGMSSL